MKSHKNLVAQSLLFSTFSVFANVQDKSPHKIFAKIYETNVWGCPEPVSGSGSTFDQTKTIRVEIPKLLNTLGIKSLIDAPCGDLHWIQITDLSMLTSYIGIDIVPQIIETNRAHNTDTKSNFYVANIIDDPLPQADMILCRDCLVHLCNTDIYKALLNFCKSGARYLLTTTYTNHPNNRAIETGDWQPLNLQKPPFNLPEPLLIINEGCTEFKGTVTDKSLALWLLEDLARIIKNTNAQ